MPAMLKKLAFKLGVGFEVLPILTLQATRDSCIGVRFPITNIGTLGSAALRSLASSRPNDADLSCAVFFWRMMLVREPLTACMEVRHFTNKPYCKDLTMGSHSVITLMTIAVYYTAVVSTKYKLSRIKSFRKPGGRIRLNTAQPENCSECILGKPLVRALALKILHHVFNFLRTHFLTEVNEHIRASKTPIVLDNFILKDQMIPKSVPRQLRNQPMILMEIVSKMGEDNIGTYRTLQFFKTCLDLRANIRKKAFFKVPDHNLFFDRSRQEHVGASFSFKPSSGACGKHHPPDFDIVALRQ